MRCQTHVVRPFQGEEETEPPPVAAAGAARKPSAGKEAVDRGDPQKKARAEERAVGQGICQVY